MSNEVVKLDNVWVYYNNVLALEGINLPINDRDFLGIIGPNGGGKTTLLKVILGLVKPTRGKVTVLGHTPEESRKYIGYVPQYSSFERDFPINVWDTVLMGCLGQAGLLKKYSRRDKQSALHCLETVGMSDFRERQIGELSIGQQQRVFIARALASKPKLLFLDEPTASIDTSMQAEFYELLKKLKEKMTIVLVSHDISAVSIYVDKIACLNRQLFYHGSEKLCAEDLKAAYQYPAEVIVHGIPHRVLKDHREMK